MLARTSFVAIALLILAAVASSAGAQDAPTARLLVTVVDPSGATVAGATVTLIGLDAAAKAVPRPPAITSASGAVTFERLPPGLYSVQGALAGFELGLLRDLTLRAGDNRHVVVLPIKRLEDSVTVSENAQTAASIRSSPTFGLALNRAEIDALSDDPAEMAAQLKDLAGFNMIIRVDSFEGADLPPKSQIKSIHITRDQFAAETHDAGGTFVDIVTQPGVGPLRVGVNAQFRDGSMSGRSAFTPTKGPEQIQRYGMDVGGTIIRDRSGFSVALNTQRLYSTPNLNAALPTGRLAQALSLTQPNNTFSASALFDYALTRDQTLRLSVQGSRITAENLGIGAYDLPERAYSTESRGFSMRVIEAGPIGRRFFINSRLSLSWQDASAHSAGEAPTIRVNDAFTSGGAQQAGGRRALVFTLASDLDYVRGIHSWRMGVQLDGGRYRADNDINYLGTYTFTSLAAFEAGRPALYVKRVGDPSIEYGNLQAGVYIQNDIRVRKTLTLSPGVRFNMQMHVPDRRDIDPRFGMTWAPFKSGRTSLRSSVGIFHGWLALPNYEQALRFDGARQQELLILNPPYPNPGTSGISPPTSKYLLSPDLVLPRTIRYSAGIDQVISPMFRINVLFQYARQAHLFRGFNRNAPQRGVRTDPSVANVIEMTPDASGGWRFLDVNATFNLGAGASSARQQAVNWRRLTLSAFAQIGDEQTNTEGPFMPPASGVTATEFGPTGEPHRRFNLSVTSSQVRNITANVTWAVVSGQPYNITLGADDNGDGLFNDRPAGSPRNAGLMPLRQTLTTRIVYAFGVGAGPTTGVAMGDRAPAAPVTGRYRFSLFVNVVNLANRANLGGYSGVMTSPFFGEPTLVVNPRKVDFGVTMSF